MPVRFVNYVITSFRAVLCQNYHIITSRARVNEIIKSPEKRKAQKERSEKPQPHENGLYCFFENN